MSNPDIPAAVAAAEAYGSEVLCASWNPLVPALVGLLDGRRAAAGPVAQDPDALLQRYYLSQQF